MQAFMQAFMLSIERHELTHTEEEAQCTPPAALSTLSGSTITFLSLRPPLSQRASLGSCTYLRSKQLGRVVGRCALNAGVGGLLNDGHDPLATFASSWDNL